MLAPSQSANPDRSNLNSFSGLVPYQIQSKKEARALLILLIITGVIILIITIYYFTHERSVIGDQLVNQANGQPFEIPPPSISPLYVKPITILYASTVVFSFCLCALAEPYIRRYVPRVFKVLLLLLSVLLLAMAIYEVFFNFALWSALMASNPGVSPDNLVNSWPIHTVQNNLAFATKISVLSTIVGVFVVLTFRASLAPVDSEIQTSKIEKP